ncbi:MAG: glutamate racemase [Bacteroidetes bacterium]|nr:MAG: glutamate racemase [Bacteroidota bacterium]
MIKSGPIGVFDSGYGGLTVLKEFMNTLPEYDYLYLGDNARAPYGTRSFETVYEYTLQCVKHLFNQGCPLVILACNTASAKALRTIQQKDLPKLDPALRVLGVIRPTTEIVGQYTKTKQVGVFATKGTVVSQSYVVEINKFYPDVEVYQEACPMWVPLVENNEYLGDGADYFIQKHIEQLLKQGPEIDTILLGCTHYPLLYDKIRKYTPAHITILTQGQIVANSLVNYLSRHSDLAKYCSTGGSRRFVTTDDAFSFEQQAGVFLGEPIKAEHLSW